MATKKLRISRKADTMVRKAIDYAKALVGAEYADIDAALGKPARWSRNALSRPSLLPVEHARALICWAESITEIHGDSRSLGQIQVVKSSLREYRGGRQTVPLLVLARDIERVSEEFDRYLDQRGRPGAKGLLQAFLRRPSIVGAKPDANSDTTYARACAWDLSWHIHGIIAKRSKSMTIRDEEHSITVTPEDLQTLIWRLEHLVELNTFPRRRVRKAARAAR
jgi:hypothetical protein